MMMIDDEKREKKKQNLKPGPGGATEVENGGARCDELELLLNLKELPHKQESISVSLRKKERKKQRMKERDNLERRSGDITEALRLSVEEVRRSHAAAHLSPSQSSPLLSS